jgi:RNA polymerase sigma-70 factor, ECF subfamily
VGARGGADFRPVQVNGQPGALVLDSERRIIGVLALEIVDGRVQSISSVVNPDKLRHVGPLGDVRALLRRDTGRG